MKFRGVNPLPPAIALWLEQQLELRGIDSVVYTRYILSLLNDETFDLNDLVTFSKGNRKLSSWKSCNLEELKRSAVVQCLTEAAEQAFEIENLVDELCVKLKEAESEGEKCLKEKTNSENLFIHDLNASSLDLANRYYTAFPALTKVSHSFEHTFPLTSVWSRNICRTFATGRRRGESESSQKDNKLLKRKDNKENILFGNSNLNGNASGSTTTTSGIRRMRSRSTVKQSSGHYRTRASTAKSLDRKIDEVSTAMKRTYGATKAMSGDLTSGVDDDEWGAGDPRGRKCLNFMQNSLGQLIGYPVSCGTTYEEHITPHRRDDKLSRTPGRKCNGETKLNNDMTNSKVVVDHFTTTAEYFDSAEIPVDFQQLLTSPSDISTVESSLCKQHPSHSSTGAASGNFIQCGTNITSSIWSDTSEKMEEDDNGGNSGNWENVCGNNTNGNSSGNNGCNGKWSGARTSILSSAWKLPFAYDKDIEGTSLAVNASTGSFYSFFDTGLISSSLLGQNGKIKIPEDCENKNDNGDNNGNLRSDNDDNNCQPEEDLLTSMKTHFRPIKNNNDQQTIQDGTIEDGNGVSKTGIANNKGGTGLYKDGATFTDTTASPLKVDYRRSESEALYLITTGEKYLEFKQTTPSYLHNRMTCGDQADLQISSMQTVSTFVPKFKVRQNEKFCQTDSSPSKEYEENDFFFPGDERFAEEMLNGCSDDDDEDGVDDIDDGDEWFESRRSGEDVEESRQAIQVSGWVTTWPVAMDSNASIWTSAIDNNNASAWMCGYNDGSTINNSISTTGGPSCPADCRMDDRNEHYLRLRDELTEEGEELLSDLSSIHLFLDPERMDEPNPNLQTNCTKNFQTRPCEIQTGTISNDTNYY